MIPALDYLRNLCCPTPGNRGRSTPRTMERGYSLSLFTVRSQGKPVPSRWLAHTSGLGFHYLFDCYPYFILAKFTLTVLFAVQGLGELLSSSIEENLRNERRKAQDVVK